jgi:hypothetical protein
VRAPPRWPSARENHRKIGLVAARDEVAADWVAPMAVEFALRTLRAHRARRAIPRRTVVESFAKAR